MIVCALCEIHYRLSLKQGLALNNGTQLITALGAEALYRAERIAKQADVVAALTIEVLEGVPDAFNEGKTSCYRYIF